MPEFLLSSTAIWTWFLAGVVVLIIELLLADLLPMGLSVACFGFGLVSWLAPALYDQLEIGHFLLVAAAVILASYFVVNPLLYKGRRLSTVSELGDRQPHKLVGLTGTTTEPVIKGLGRAAVNGALWKCHGPEMASGTSVVVTAVSGNRLIVRPLE